MLVFFRRFGKSVLLLRLCTFNVIVIVSVLVLVLVIVIAIAIAIAIVIVIITIIIIIIIIICSVAPFFFFQNRYSFVYSRATSTYLLGYFLLLLVFFVPYISLFRTTAH